jgi:NHS family nucleoside permease-like MFS transporter/NHS family xanthosine MFS transporter
MMMTNGFGASLGMLAAGWVMNIYTINENGLMISNEATGGWTMAWTIFATYALIVAIAFSMLFKYKHTNKDK